MVPCGACVPHTEVGRGEGTGLEIEKAEAHLLLWVCLTRGPVQLTLNHGLGQLANILSI